MKIFVIWMILASKGLYKFHEKKGSGRRNWIYTYLLPCRVVDEERRRGRRLTTKRRRGRRTTTRPPPSSHCYLLGGQIVCDMMDMEEMSQPQSYPTPNRYIFQNNYYL